MVVHFQRAFDLWNNWFTIMKHLVRILFIDHVKVWVIQIVLTLTWWACAKFNLYIDLIHLIIFLRLFSDCILVLFILFYFFVIWNNWNVFIFVIPFCFFHIPKIKLFYEKVVCCIKMLGWAISWIIIKWTGQLR